MATYKIVKDPDSTTKYEIDWTDELAQFSPADTISSATWTSNNGVTVSSSSESGNITSVIVAGGNVGKRANLQCRLVTVGGQTLDRTIELQIVNR
jgi:hypothetical protein